MNKILLIIKREYLTRVKKKSFIIMTILGPILMASVIIAPIAFATMTDGQRQIGIVDESGYFSKTFKNTKDANFQIAHLSIEEAKKNMDKLGYDVVIWIPQPSYGDPSAIFLYYRKQPGMIVESYIRNSINDDLRILKMKNDSVSQETIKKIQTDIKVNTKKINDLGVEEESMAMRDYILGFTCGLIIYFFIFLFGSQVMRGVIEEKTSRIVEVIISSVKPFQLMMGKIIGVALVGLTQFALWVILTITIVTSAQLIFKDQLNEINKKELVQIGKTMGSPNIDAQVQMEGASNIIKAITTIDYPVIIGSFLFYFLFGYLMYAALFAAIGGAVDSETDTQQFMLPITIPLVLSIVVNQMISNNPDGSIAFWFSIIPLTSPVTMMARIPYGVPWEQVVLSMSLLVGGFIFTTWLAARIYRTGILMYGKKPSYKEMWKWIRYKN